MNKENSLKYLDSDILKSFFESDVKICNNLIHKYNLRNTKHTLLKHISRFRNKIDSQILLSEKIKEFNSKGTFVNKILLSEKFYKKFKNDYYRNPDDSLMNLIELSYTGKQIDFVTDNRLQLNVEPKIESKRFPFIENEPILVIADIHTPFDLDEYLDFCVSLRNKYNTKNTIFIGDVIDNCATSKYGLNPDGYSPGDELKYAKERLKRWYKEFPESLVMIGNHCARIQKLMFDSRISKEWIKDISDVLNVPNWTFLDEFEYQNILFTHGSGGGTLAAYEKALYKRKSVVMGHLHTQCSINYVNEDLFGMVVGCGINRNTYPFNYAKEHKKAQILSAGIITKDLIPILETMKS